MKFLSNKNQEGNGSKVSTLTMDPLLEQAPTPAGSGAVPGARGADGIPEPGAEAQPHSPVISLAQAWVGSAGPAPRVGASVCFALF